MDFQQWFYQIPKLTRTYLASVFLVTLCITYIQSIPVFYYLFLHYDLIFKNFQIWRFFTNFLIIGKFSTNFLFFMLMMYGSLDRFEKNAIAKKKYAEFVMMLIYTIGFVILISMTMYFLFSVEPNVSLCFELLFALIYIDSKREPDRPSSVWFIQVKNSQVPFVLLFFSLVSGGSIINDIAGIVAGHCYFYLKDIAPISHRLNLLKTPQLLINYLDRPPARSAQVGFRTLENSNASGNFGNAGASTNSNTNGSSFRQENSGTGNQFQPFAGQGRSWGGN